MMHSNLKARQFAKFVIACALAVAFATSSPAQSIWQLTPYNVSVWVAFEDHPEIPASWRETIPAQLETHCEAVLGAIWNTTVSTVPTSFRQQALSGATPAAFGLVSSNESLASADKLFVVAVSVQDGGFKITVRELDISTRVWSGSQSVVSFATTDVVRETFRLLTEVFLPLAQIVRVEDTDVSAEVRAGALSLPESSSRYWNNPAQVHEGDFLLPFIRKKDRDGKVKENGVSEVKYTVLLVKQEERGTLECEAHSGYRQAFKTRRSSRTQQLALVGRNTGRKTVLHTHDRADESINLVGYDVFAREPGSDQSTFIGRTDWRGELEIPVGSTPVRILFIKSGSRVLAKLPVVPGLQARIDVALRDDDARLEAEGFLLGVQESLVDLVARREILTIRIKKMIEKGRYDDAEPLITELRRLPTREDFENLVQQRKQLLSTGDARVQDRIDKLFTETRELFTTFLDPRRVQQLQDALREGRAKGPPKVAETTKPEITADPDSE